MSYEQIKDLRPAEFKRYCGVEPETFKRMGELVSHRLTKQRRKIGRPPKLTVEDQVLLTLEYWREYRTLFHLATSWGLHESNVCRIIRRVEDILTKSKAFRLPGKRSFSPRTTRSSLWW
jgi:Helix-turn-helix of DDE superfamily endonuclease